MINHASQRINPALQLKLQGWRARTLIILLLGGFAALGVRAFYLQGMNNEFLQAKGEARFTRSIEMPASRGPILDRNGVPLAISTPVESIWMSPAEAEFTDDNKKQLARALQMDLRDIEARLANEDKNFVWLKRQISPEQAAKVMALKIPGVFQQREFRRFYPQGEVTAHVIGFTGVDDHGQEGIELALQAAGG
jgi:cell division protein FtsI (penicillin-binding protein 3)